MAAFTDEQVERLRTGLKKALGLPPDVFARPVSVAARITAGRISALHEELVESQGFTSSEATAFVVAYLHGGGDVG